MAYLNIERATLMLILGLCVGASGCFFDPAGLPFDRTDGTAPAPDASPDAGDGATASCGNGAIDQGEDCDGQEFGGQSCVTLGFDSGELTCTAGCQINPAGCSTCGDDVQQGQEHCDGNDLGGTTCQGLGFDGGSLTCGTDCLFETSLCTGAGCGDGVIGANEQCDGADLNGETCATMGFTDGVLSCGVTCQLDTSGCDTCGDAIQTGLEACDGTDLGGGTCVGLGHDGGDLSCTTGCFFDESACADCGNSVLEIGESCDTTELNGADCLSQGFDGGSLSCGPTCLFDESACTTCGDGQLDPSEECDDGGANDDQTPDACRTDCTNPSCGDGVCDTADQGGNCPLDCKVVVFADDFDGAWANGWTTGDDYPALLQDLVDTWEPATNAAHSGTKSLWCAGNGNNSSNYDNNMGAWAVHAVDLSAATAGMNAYYDMWLWVHVTDGDDYFSASFSTDGGSNWTTLGSFNGDTSGWQHHSWDISAAAGNSNVMIGLWFYSDGLNSSAHGAYVDDIEVWYAL